MKRTPTSVARAAALIGLIGLASAPASAQVFGSLANFDAVNDTGQIAHGFEIQIEDASYDHSKIYSVFGLDRDFGVPPTSVERYGAPTITDIAGFGVKIRYQASFAGGAWNVGTPTGPYPFAGDSCWPLGNAQYASGTLSCDHFGVATYGTPQKVTYNWLLDTANSGVLSAQQAAIPAVNFAYQPPPPGPVVGPRPVVVEIEAHKADNEVFGSAFWVKVFAKHVDHNVKLDDLMKGHADVPKDAEVEVEFEIFQAGDKNGNKLNNLALNPGDAGLVLRYEFYKYQGDLSAAGEALCGAGNGGGGKGGGGGSSPADCGGLGDYVGAQMAAFNAVQPALAAVPEPQTWALMLAGLASVGWLTRRRR
jgi:hypothetical protein